MTAFGFRSMSVAMEKHQEPAEFSDAALTFDWF